MTNARLAVECCTCRSRVQTVSNGQHRSVLNRRTRIPATVHSHRAPVPHGRHGTPRIRVPRKRKRSVSPGRQVKEGLTSRCACCMTNSNWDDEPIPLRRETATMRLGLGADLRTDVRALSCLGTSGSNPLHDSSVGREGRRGTLNPLRQDEPYPGLVPRRGDAPYRGLRRRSRRRPRGIRITVRRPSIGES